MPETDWNALAERCEAAGADEQRELLITARVYISPQPMPPTKLDHPWFVEARRFRAMLDAEAYESAALMLVPPRPWRVCTLSDYPHNNFQSGAGWFVNLSNDVCGYGREGPIATVMARAATPALAILAACCRARGQVASGEMV